MAGEAQRAALWLYRQANRLGLLSIGPVQRAFGRAYFTYKRHLEDPFYNLARRHPELFRGGHVVDVGANIGYTACVFAAAIDRGFRVLAIEPATDNFRRLKSTIAARNFQESITPIHAAVGDRVGSTEMRLNPFHPGDHRVLVDSSISSDEAVERVEMITVDQAVSANGMTPVVFIKVDVQGYELHVCRGMKETLNANPGAVVAVEYSPASLREYDADPQVLPQFFTDRGYRAFKLTQRGELLPVDAADLPLSMQAPGYVDLLFSMMSPELRG